MRKMHLVVGGKGIATKFACGNKNMMTFGGNFTEFSKQPECAQCEKCAASKLAKFYAKNEAIAALANKPQTMQDVANMEYSTSSADFPVIVVQDETIEIVAIEETPEQTMARDKATMKAELYKRKINARKLSQEHNNTIINEVEKENKMEFTKEQLKAIKALQAAEKSPAWNRVSAYVIVYPYQGPLATQKYGKIKVIHPADGMGALKVFVWDCTGDHGLQMGQASGCGFDKMSAALDGLKFDGLEFTDHPKNWEMQLREAGYTIVQAI